jgi:hypothetical protein
MDTRQKTPAAQLLRNAETGILCVHFAADAREHSMWYLDAGDLGPEVTGFTAGLRAEWHASPAGNRRATVLRRGGDALCEAMYLTTPDAGATVNGSTATQLYRRDRSLLRNENVASHAAAVLSSIRQRPLLATFARAIELPPPLARHVHALLLRTLPPDAACVTCGGAGDVNGEPCLACS